MFILAVNNECVLCSCSLVLPSSPQTLCAANIPSRTPEPKRPAPALTFFIATTGDDANPGTRERPFATLQRARDEIRKLKQRGPLPKGGITVLVTGGRYNVTKTFTLGAEDSGTETAPIVYRAAEGEMPTFTGGLRLTGFQPVRDAAILNRLSEEARDKVVQVDLGAHGLSSFKPLTLGGCASGRGVQNASGDGTFLRRPGTAVGTMAQRRIRPHRRSPVRRIQIPRSFRQQVGPAILSRRSSQSMA